jgi:type I restriction enzyme S subunit
MDRRIPRYVRAKQKLIKLLEEQKQAIIHQAVTGQIDVRTGKPYPAYKDSGVEWLEDIPTHWNVVRLKSLLSTVTSGSRGWSGYAAETGVLFLRIGNLTRASIDLDLDDVVRLQLPNHVLGEATRSQAWPDDILLSITAFIGSVAVVPNSIEEAYVSQHVACCRPRVGAVNSRWVAYVLLSAVGQTHGKLSMYGGTKQGLSLDDVKNYVVLMPPLVEQDRLLRWIEVMASSIDAGLARAKREIVLIKEYRTCLISNVVTGKLDVREAAAHLQEAEFNSADPAQINEEDQDGQDDHPDDQDLDEHDDHSGEDDPD